MLMSLIIWLDKIVKYITTTIEVEAKNKKVLELLEKTNKKFDNILVNFQN